MAASPEFKVYDPAGVYQAACKEIEAAACLVSFYGEGSTIRHRHGFICWTEGRDGCASAAYGTTAEKIIDRLLAHYNPPEDDDLGPYGGERRLYALG